MRDYLCNRMYSLDEDGVESYLGQLVTLAVSSPSASLDRLVFDFCSRSVRLACKARARARSLRVTTPLPERAVAQVSWLLSAIASDGRAGQPEAVRAFRLKCETAAVHGALRRATAGRSSTCDTHVRAAQATGCCRTTPLAWLCRTAQRACSRPPCCARCAAQSIAAAVLALLTRVGRTTETLRAADI